jgi:hypothetical protein
MQCYAELSSLACHAMAPSQTQAEPEPGQCPAPPQPAMRWSACQCSARPVHYVMECWLRLGHGSPPSLFFLLEYYCNGQRDKEEFTFVPFAVGATNRSRLDFFVMSEELVEQCINCRIPHSLNSLLFDHKQVTPYFKRDNPYKKQTINDVVLSDPDLAELVNITTIECYINHLLPNGDVSDIEIDTSKHNHNRMLY